MRYIPAHEILAIKNASLAIPVGYTKLIPDQLFALDYGGNFRVFALEVDRGTEPKTSPAKRKSWARSIEQYQQVVEHRLYKSHYGLKANLLILWVFNSRTNEDKFLGVVSDAGGPLCDSVLARSLPEFGQCTLSSSPLEEMFSSRWNRVMGKPVSVASGR